MNQAMGGSYRRPTRERPKRMPRCSGLLEICGPMDRTPSAKRAIAMTQIATRLVVFPKQIPYDRFCPDPVPEALFRWSAILDSRRRPVPRGERVLVSRSKTHLCSQAFRMSMFRTQPVATMTPARSASSATKASVCASVPRRWVKGAEQPMGAVAQRQRARQDRSYSFCWDWGASDCADARDVKIRQ